MTATLGPTQLDERIVDLGRSTSRRDFMTVAGKLLGTSILATLGLQTYRPRTALGSIGCQYCGPSQACPSACCTSQGSCKDNSTCDGATGYVWDDHWYCGATYRCRDCWYAPSSSGICICIKWINPWGHCIIC